VQRISTKELPAWFKLSRYEKLDRIELGEWLRNLFRRARYLNGNRILEEDRKQIECLLRENTWPPLIFTFNDKNVQETMKIKFPDPAKPLETLTVNSLQTGSIAALFNVISYMISTGKDELSRQMAEAVEYVERDTEDKREESNEELDNFLNQPFELLLKSFIKDFAAEKNRVSLLVEVRLSAPDKVIVEDFSRWLTAARREFDFPAEKIFTEAKREDLINYRVLPYLDLTLWAALEQVTIPNAVMAEALFPDAGVDAPYRVRRVTKPKADWAIQWSVLRALHNQLVS